MRHGTRWQKDRESHWGKLSSSSVHSGKPAGQLVFLKTKIIQLFLGIILFLVVSLLLVILGDRRSVTQVGLQLGLWPHTINHLRATSELNYNNVYQEEEVLRTKSSQDFRNLSTEEEHTSIPKSANNIQEQHIDQEAPNQASDNHPEEVEKTDFQPSVEDAETRTGGDPILQKRLALNTSSLLGTHRRQDLEAEFAAEDKGWIQFPYIAVNETEEIMLQYRQNGTVPCHQIRTQSAQILGLQQQPSELDGDGNNIIQLNAGPVYELVIVSVGEDGQPRCQGGDYLETDLSGPLWKSRPPVLDRNDGTYSVRLQMDPRFVSGLYTFRVVLLFSNFHALHHHPDRWARMEEVATYQIKFVVPDQADLITLPTGDFRSEELSSVEAGADSELAPITTVGPELPMCKLEDFSKKYWSGRWTRDNATEDCEYDRYGRWQCVDLNLQCQKPWCEGRVGQLHSNGWVYSAHCAFKIFEKEEAWQCLDGKWLFFWGDSNHMDTIRNLLNFVLGFDLSYMERRMDKTYISPLNNSSSVRITSMFNGHSNVSKNYEGLFSLHDPDYAQQLRSFFTGDVGPDFMIMNSGLHDGLYWKDLDRYMKDGVEFAADFWNDVWNQMKARRPDLLYRTTVSTGGHARNMSFNPHKMEIFNHLMVDKFLKMELERFHIIDGFDYTYPWHYDHKTNDGVHYGRAPSKSKWAGGNIGHQYFVDLMLVHMLLNAICAPSS